MKYLLIGMVLLCSLNAFSGFGGGRSGGSFGGGRSFSSPSRSSFSSSSSFGGSRGSMGRPVTITRPAPPAAPQSSTTHSTTNVVHTGGGGGIGLGHVGSFVGGMAVGNMLSRPAVVGGGVVAAAPGAPVYQEGAPVAVQAQCTSVWEYIFWTLIIGVLALFVISWFFI